MHNSSTHHKSHREIKSANWTSNLTEQDPFRKSATVKAYLPNAKAPVESVLISLGTRERLLDFSVLLSTIALLTTILARERYLRLRRLLSNFGKPIAVGVQDVGQCCFIRLREILKVDLKLVITISQMHGALVSPLTES
jgi:hypothetical protein